MSGRFVVGVVAAVLAVLVVGGIIIWIAGGDGSPRTAALEESRRSYDATWHLYGGTGSQSFWADLEAVAGCDTQGEIATAQDPATGDSGKHVSGVAPSACRFEVAVNSRANSALYAWINEALSETYTRKNLTLLKKPSSTSASNQGMSISLADVLIERIELPHFQTSSTGAAMATVALTVRAEQTTRDLSPMVPNPPSGGPAPVAATSFAVDVTGIGPVTASRFEPWSAAVEIAQNAAAESELGEPVYSATETSLGDLGFSVPIGVPAGHSDAGQLHNWFEDSVLESEGNPDPAQERTLTFTARHPQSTATLLTVTFTNVGIFAQPSYALGNDPEKFLFYAEGASFAGVSATP